MKNKDRNSETREKEKYYPGYGWRPISEKIDKC